MHGSYQHTVFWDPLKIRDPPGVGLAIGCEALYAQMQPSLSSGRKKRAKLVIKADIL